MTGSAISGDRRSPLPLAGVVGWPVAHSLSPFMMTRWLEASGLPGSYAAFEVEPNRFSEAMGALSALSIRGVNITLPHKQAAMQIADTVSAAASAIGAANLLTTDERGRLHADNTDHTGIEAALDELGLKPSDGPVVLVGAGGAARAALYVLKTAGWSDIRIVNRTPARAKALAESFGVPASIHALSDVEVALKDAALVIQSSSMGMANQAVFQPDLGGLPSNAGVFDMVYAPLTTPLLAAARACGLRTVDGLAMLIGQARPGFELFFGAPPPKLDMRSLLAGALGLRR
ncbi:MAG: shikimate dehydrogenase [Pseudomonadota bacterium]